MRIITGKKVKDKVSIESLRKSTGTTSVNHLICYHILMDMYNILKDNTSATLKEMFTEKLGSSNITTRSATQNKVTAPVNYGRNNDFSYYGPTLWNLLPDHIRNAKIERPEATDKQLTNKEKTLNKQKSKATLKKAFKSNINKWISQNIPTD